MNNTRLLGSKDTPKGCFSFYMLTAPLETEWKDKVEFFIQESKTDDWKEDIRHRLNGDYAASSLDRYFVAVDTHGEMAAILWYGFSRKTGKGNFGHVFTAHRFRKLGLLDRLMQYFSQDFHGGSGNILSCICSRPGPLKCYMAYNFEMILGDRPGPLALLRKGHSCRTFAELEQTDYADTRIALIRPGTPGDQFDFDKFLNYTHAMRTAPVCCSSRGPMTIQYREYRQAILRTFHGGIVEVAENHSGQVLGYAFAVPQPEFPDSAWLDFTIHPDALKEVSPLIRSTAGKFEGAVYTGLFSTDTEKIGYLKAAGFAEEARLERYCGEKALVILKWAQTKPIVSITNLTKTEGGKPFQKINVL